MKKIFESAGLVILNIIGLCVGFILGLIFIQDAGGTQDNHFLGGLFSLVEIAIGMMIGIVIGIGTTLLITALYMVMKHRK